MKNYEFGVNAVIFKPVALQEPGKNFAKAVASVGFAAPQSQVATVPPALGAVHAGVPVGLASALEQGLSAIFLALGASLFVLIPCACTTISPFADVPTNLTYLLGAVPAVDSQPHAPAAGKADPTGVV